MPTRRELLAASAAASAGLALGAAPPVSAERPLRVGVLSATIRGKPQRANGHTWHFASYLHPEVKLDEMAKIVDPGTMTYFRDVIRHPRYGFGGWPFPDTRMTHYYDPEPKNAADFCKAFPGVVPVSSPEELAASVDAVWLGDASGFGDDHLSLIAPALERGLPTFCDKPIGETVAGTRAILQLAQKHKAPLMSSSLFRHELGTEQALRLRDEGKFGKLVYVIASMFGAYSPERWFVYGQHPAWTVMTLCGPDVEAVSLYAYQNTAHGLVTYADRTPAEIWFGRPDAAPTYNRTTVAFEKKTYDYTPSIEDDFRFGHHYRMYRMAAVFREMALTRKELVPHQEILEVTAIIHAGAKSLAEKSRLVRLDEVLG